MNLAHNVRLTLLFLGFVLTIAVFGQGRVNLSPRADSLVKFLASDIPSQVLEDSLPHYLKPDRYRTEILALESSLEKDSSSTHRLGIFRRLGEIYQLMANTAISKDYYLKSLQIAEQLNDLAEMAWLNALIGHNTRLGDVSDGYKKYYQNAITLFEECTDPLCSVESLYIQALLAEDSQVSIQYLEKAEGILLAEISAGNDHERLQSKLGKVRNCHAYFMPEANERLDKYFEAAESSAQARDQLLKVFLYNNIGYVYYNKGENPEAIDWYIKALNIAVDEGFKGLVRNSVNNIGNSYYELGKFKTAYAYLRANFYLSGSLTNEAFNSQMLRNRAEYELDKAELQNNVLSKDRALKVKQNFVLVIISLLLSSLFALAVYSRKKISRSNRILSDQAAKLKELDRVKSRFFANISHELKTPLSLIKAPIEDLLYQTSSAKSSNKKKLQIAHQNTAHLQQLIDEIMDLAKLEAGKLTLNTAPVPLKESLDMILAQYEFKLTELGVQIQLIFDIDSHTSVMLDERVFSKIIHNLISNAIKFTSRGGEIIVQVGWREDSELFVKVIDQGIGIHPDDLPFVFNRFYQSELPEATAKGGTGIGLALCKEMAEFLGGDLTVTSVHGQGATFVLVLPVTKSSHQEIEQRLISDIPIAEVNNQLHKTLHLYSEKFELKRPVLLIAEDHPELRYFLKEMLTPFFNVITASDGQKAFDILMKEHVDLLISDVMMPYVDGFELLLRIKQTERLHKVSVIMLTAKNAPEDKIVALNMGIDDYITKPFDQAELKARVKNIMSNRIQLFGTVTVAESVNNELDEEMDHFQSNFDLTKRELEVLYYLRKRYGNAEIADALFVSVSTVKFHLNNVYFKLGIQKRKEALQPLQSFETTK